MLGSMMEVPLNVINIIKHAALNHPQVEIASREPGNQLHCYTYANAYRRICQLGRALARLGLQPGDRVATLAWNHHRHFELYYATAGMGLVCHTINPRLHAADVAWIANHAQDRVLCFDRSFLPLVMDLLPELKGVEHFIVLNDSTADCSPALVNLQAYERLLASESDGALDWPTLDENSPCGLCYTSGTTGKPKGVTYSHRSTVLHAYASALPDSFRLSARETVMPVVPMFHVNAWGLPYSLPLVGARIVFPGEHLDGQSLYTLCEQQRVTLAAGVPTVWLGILEHVKQSRNRFSSLERALIGGSAASERMLHTLEKLHGVEVLHAWGMTEISPTGAINQPTPASQQQPSEALTFKKKQGRAIPGILFRLEDEAGEEQSWDGESAGHLLVRGPWVVDTYAGGIAGARADGWFDTGDIATIDPHGFMQIVDRSKDLIKSGGEWISSVTLEDAATAHPDVVEAGVIGIPHPRWVERPLLVCVTRDGSNLDAQALKAFLSARLAKWWVPDAIELVERLPHGATGKLLKTELRKQFAHYILPTAAANELEQP